MLESLALRGLCRCSSEELQFVFCPWAVEPCPPPSHGAWASWACEQRRGERVAAMMGPDSQGVAAARHNRRCESWQLRWRASRGHGGAALRAVTNQRRWWVSSYPIRRIRSHKRGAILYGAVSDYVGFDYSGDGKKRNLTQTFDAVNR